MTNKIVLIVLNSSAILALVLLLVAPIYFANNFAKVAGARNESRYLVVSQVEKFPQMTFAQSANDYTITFTKQASPQAYLGVVLINNPTNSTKSYRLLNKSTEDRVFFGEDPSHELIEIKMPAQTSISISLISTGQTQKGKVEFNISAN